MATLAQVLASHFDQLPPEQQENLLNHRWDLVQPALSTSQLQHAAGLPITNAGNREISSFHREALKSAALARWYERDPEAAKQFVGEQLRSAQPGFTADALWFLPNDPLPEQETFWAQALLDPTADKDPSVLAPLMARFGTGMYTAQMASALHTSLGAQPCASQAGTLAYLVRFDPELAAPVLNEAVQARVHMGCYSQLFTDIAHLTSNDTLKLAAMEALGETDPQTVSDAARYLTQFGDKETKQPLLDRYRAWSAQWAAKVDELDSPSPSRGPEHYLDVGLGQVLGQALLINQGWLPDGPLRTEVVDLCIGEQVCQFLRSLANDSPGLIPVSFTHLYAGDFFLNIGTFQTHSLTKLPEKLSQYPKSTTFHLASSTQTSDDRCLAKQIKKLFEQSGFNLAEEPSSPKSKPSP